MPNNRLITINMLKGDGCEKGPLVKIRLVNKKAQTDWFLARLDTGSDVTLIPYRIGKEARLKRSNTPIDIIYGNGQIDESVHPLTCQVEFEDTNEVLSTNKIVLSERKTAFLGMDILSQTILFLAADTGGCLLTHLTEPKKSAWKGAV